VQLARRMGCRVLTVSRRDESDINLKKDAQLAGAKELTGGKGPDVVVDTIGDTEVMASALRVLAVGGRFSFISVGRSKEPGKGLEVDMMRLYGMEQSIIGCSSLKHDLEEAGGWLREMVPGFEKGELKAADESEFKVVGFDEAVEAYEAAEKGGGKYVIAFA
jgi:NADPH:quinone reductase